MSCSVPKRNSSHLFELASMITSKFSMIPKYQKPSKRTAKSLLSTFQSSIISTPSTVLEKKKANYQSLFFSVMLKGLNYYSDDPGKVGQTFVRLEKDFESHVEFYKQYADTLKLLEEPEIKRFFEVTILSPSSNLNSFFVFFSIF